METPYDSHLNASRLLVCEHCNHIEDSKMTLSHNKTHAETFTVFFHLLSEYIQFLKLREWSCYSNDTKSIFSLHPLLMEEQLGNAPPILRFREAVEELKGLVREHPTSSFQVDGLDINLQRLRELAALTEEYYKNTRTLVILDQKIIILQAILLLLPLSHPERTLHYLQLGVDFKARFQHTDELYDLDHAISHHSEVSLTRMNKYIPLRRLARCFIMRSKKVNSDAELDKAMDILLEALSEMPFPHPYRHAFLLDLGSLAMERYERTLRSSTETIKYAILYYRDALASCTAISDYNLEPVLSIITSFSAALIQLNDTAGIEVDAYDLVNLLQKFLALDPSPSQKGASYLFFEFTTLLFAASNEGYSGDMLCIIRLFVEESQLSPAAAKIRHLTLFAFSRILISQCMRSESLEDLNEAIALCQDALICSPPEERAESRVESLEILVNLLVVRFRVFGVNEDSEEVISIYRDMLALIKPADGRLKVMESYANFLVSKFEKCSQVEDIDEAISLYQAAITLVSQSDDSSADSFQLLFELARALLFRMGGEDEDRANECFNEAISCLRTAVASPIDHVNYTETRRIVSLLAQYEETGYDVEIDEQHKLVEFTQGGEEQHSDAWFKLSTTMVSNIEKEQNFEELEKMIDKYRRSLSLQPFPHPKRLETLVCLGKALAMMFKISGRGIALLDEGVLLLREATAISPKSTIVLGALHDVLSQKMDVEEFNRDDYLQECNAILFQKLSLSSPSNMYSSVEMLTAWITQKLDNNDLPSSGLDINSIFTDIKLTTKPGSLERAGLLALVHDFSFGISADIKHLDESIYHARQAVMICPDDHSERPEVIHYLGNQLVARFDIQRNPEDLEEALHYYPESIIALPPGNYLTCSYVEDLGNAMIRFLYNTNNVNTTILNIIGEVYRAGALQAASSPASVRFRMSRDWALLADICNHESALEAYEQTINFLPRLTSMGTNVITKQKTFKSSKIDGISRSAALFAIKIGRYDKAVEFLEAGRAVFWLQAFQLRSPMDKLREAAPELEAKLSKISVELDRASMNIEVPYAPGNAEKKKRDEKAFKLEQLNEEWTQTLDSIHELEGFQDFLLPKKLSSLQASIDRPVILLIPDEEESHALVILTDEVKHVELSRASYEKLQELVARLPGSGRKREGRLRGVASELAEVLRDSDPVNDTIGSETHERTGLPRHFGHIDSEEHIRYVLQTLWNDVICPIIYALGISVARAPLKVCWCPTGIFSFLPVHAAGIYGADMSSIESASDYFISSYTPIVSALTNDKPTADTAEDFKMMVAINQRSLPHTIQEMKAIEKHVFQDCLLKFGSRDSAPASVESVVSSLSTVSIAHFACHGKQFPDEPLDSSLILEDGELKISRIMEQRMPKAALAFLCACETAMGDKELPDEVMHLGASLLFSGFRGVVATMWSIDDEDGPVIADTFYAHLFKDDSKNPDVALAAEGVHNATEKLREQRVGFKRWVPFIHIGS